MTEEPKAPVETTPAVTTQKPEPAPVPRDELASLRLITLTAIIIAALVYGYYIIADRVTPFASNARVQAFVLRVSPEVTGQVQQVNITDNSIVEAGTELFRIDATPFNYSVQQAEARLAQASQSVGASAASVNLSQAKLDEARAAEANVKAQSARILELVRRGVYARAREDDAYAAINEARAKVESAEADLRRASAELGSADINNPQIRDALSALETARFNQSRTSITAPGRGVVTNLQLAGGQMVVAGQPALTFISAEDVWLQADMRENNLEVLETGQRAEVVLDVLPGRVFQATVRTIGWGIASGATDQSTGLQKTSSSSGWLTDPERFPVNFVFETEQRPVGARYGSKAAVIVYTSDNPIMNLLAWLRIRAIAILTYIS